MYLCIIDCFYFTTFMLSATTTTNNGDGFVTLFLLHCDCTVFSQSTAARRSTYQKNVVQYCHKMTQLFHDSSALSSFTVLVRYGPNIYDYMIGFLTYSGKKLAFIQQSTNKASKGGNSTEILLCNVNPWCSGGSVINNLIYSLDTNIKFIIYSSNERNTIYLEGLCDVNMTFCRLL